jgi:hypothetical protein
VVIKNMAKAMNLLSIVFPYNIFKHQHLLS